MASILRSSVARRLPKAFWLRLRRAGERPTRFVLSVSVARQRMDLFEQSPPNASAGDAFPPIRQPIDGAYLWRRSYLISTSAWGVGQRMNSNQTPLGLHRIREKVGGGFPIGTVFKSRVPVGLTWQGLPKATIVHRILWLEGLEPGFNQGGDLDSHARYIYLHGLGDEPTLGTPNSHGCIHLAAGDLMPLFERLPAGTLVWIQAN